MRIAWLPHAAKRIAACALFAFGTLILQGCGDDSDSAAGAPAAPTKDVAPAPDPYAALDAKFPEGRPKPSSVEERGQDSDYQAALQVLQDETFRLNQAVAAAQAEVDAFRAQYAKDATRRFGHAPSEADLKSPEVGKYVEKYMVGHGVSAEERLRCLRLCENLALGTAAVGYRTESMHGAGSPQAQRIMIARQGNIQAKKQMAKEIAGIE